MSGRNDLSGQSDLRVDAHMPLRGDLHRLHIVSGQPDMQRSRDMRGMADL
jgi:hypothetical protein